MHDYCNVTYIISYMKYMSGLFLTPPICEVHVGYSILIRYNI